VKVVPYKSQLPLPNFIFMVFFASKYKRVRSMPKASEIKKNAAVELNGKTYIVKDINKMTPSGRAGASLYRMRLYEVGTGAKADESFKADEILNLVDFHRNKVSFSYVDGDEYVFMDDEDYSSYSLNSETISEELPFITENTKGLQILLVEEKPVGIELPASVDLIIIETDPSIKGASASARTKPATLATGLVVQVPEYIASGEKIRVNTAESKFMGRADP
jgi:elongation factor P